MEEIPEDHPRNFSLKIREKISDAMEKGITHKTGLIAHGRGEAFDYLIGEKTLSVVDMAEKVAAAALINAGKPVISLNGNVVALIAEDCIRLANSIPANLEVNLFHRTEGRVEKLIQELERLGASRVFGLKGDAKIPGLEHNRSLCDREGIFSADVVLVPLEDGDRCQALRNMGKTVIAIDLNPLSRTARTANITIVDNVVRAVPNIEKWVNKLINMDKKILDEMVQFWNNNKNLQEVLSLISKRLSEIN